MIISGKQNQFAQLEEPEMSSLRKPQGQVQINNASLFFVVGTTFWFNYMDKYNFFLLPEKLMTLLMTQFLKGFEGRLDPYALCRHWRTSYVSAVLLCSHCFSLACLICNSFFSPRLSRFERLNIKYLVMYVICPCTIAATIIRCAATCCFYFTGLLTRFSVQSSKDQKTLVFNIQSSAKMLQTDLLFW